MTVPESTKQEALRVAQERHPGAERYTVQMVAKEVCFHAWKNGTGVLVHTDVFVEAR